MNPETFQVYKNGVRQFSLRWFHSVDAAKLAIDDQLRKEAFSRLPSYNNYRLPSLDEDEQRERDEIALQEWVSDQAERQLEDRENGRV